MGADGALSNRRAGGSGTMDRFASLNTLKSSPGFAGVAVEV
jgi:hypothetical protein